MSADLLGVGNECDCWVSHYHGFVAENAADQANQLAGISIEIIVYLLVFVD